MSPPVKRLAKLEPLMVTVTLPLLGPIDGAMLFTNGTYDDVLTVT